MPTQAIFAARAFTPFREIPNAVIVVEQGKIAAIGSRGQIPIPPQAVPFQAHNLTAVPGFLDVHLHGAGGHDVMEATPDSLGVIAETIARHGTTSLLATTISATADQTCRSAVAVAEWIRRQAAAADGKPRAEILGIHFEGPFINPARRGVHPLEWIVPPSADLLRTFLQAASGAARILTLAPELPGAAGLMAMALDAGLVVSLGHTDANYAETMSAIAQGAKHAAHLFNAMRSFQHREPGVVGAVLTAPSVSAELIADFQHLHSSAIKLALAAKGFRNLILVSDGIAATCMPDGQYRLGSIEVSVEGGVCRNSEGKLAGSTLTLDRALRNMVALGAPLQEALAMITANPARLLGLQARKGILSAGADADLVLLDSELQVRAVMTRGYGLAHFAQMAQS